MSKTPQTVVEEAPVLPKAEVDAPFVNPRVKEVENAQMGSGDPIRDNKLMKEQGTLYDPATNLNDVNAAESNAGIDPDLVVTEQTSAEMDAGRAAINRHKAGTIAKGGVRTIANPAVPRQNVVSENMATPAKAPA